MLLHGRSMLLPIDMQAVRANGLTGLLDELACGSVQSATVRITNACHS